MQRNNEKLGGKMDKKGKSTRRDFLKKAGTTAAAAATASWPLWATPKAHAAFLTAAVRQVPGFTVNTLPANDDGFTARIPLPFLINFLGVPFTGVFVNNNGNVTFDAGLFTFTPFGLTATAHQIIAPYFGDVDTRGAGNTPLTYGLGTVNCQPAFGVDWFNVGYFSSHVDKLNTFQLILISRPDTGPGNFDIELNYGSIRWETGDASGGVGGLGGSSARVGFSNGTGNPGTSFELAGSAIPGSFLDTGPLSLIGHRLNSSINGRYKFFARNGTLVTFEEITGVVSAYRPLRYAPDPRTRILTGILTVANNGRAPAACIGGDANGAWGPTISVMISGLPAGVTLLNASARTRSGAYLYTLPNRLLPLRGVLGIPIQVRTAARVPISTFHLGFPMRVFSGLVDPTVL